MSILDFDDAIWSDAWYRSLKPAQKLLFIYLWTNKHRGISGIYHVDPAIICFETGLNKNDVEKHLEILYPKILVCNNSNLYFVLNFVRRQFLRTGRISDKIETAITNQLHLLPQGHEFIGIFLNYYPELDIPYRYPIQKKGDPINRVQVKERVKDGVKERESLNAVNAEFEKFWSLYPKRDGKKLGKGKALDKFKKLKPEQIPEILIAVENYSKSNRVNKGYIKDPFRFLEVSFWKDWMEPDIPQQPKSEWE